MSGPLASRDSAGARPTVAPALVLALVAGVVAAASAPALPAPPAVTAEIRFAERSAEWGIDFRHHHGGSGRLYMPETMGSGMVIFDYDGDGDEDLFFVDGGALPGYEGEAPRSRLFRNEGGRFADRTDDSGIAVTAYGMGATAGDVDGDGDLDLYVTAVGPDQLFENLGDGRFRDATADAGLGDPSFNSSAAFADVDRDGDLDLYVVAYVDWSLENNPICGKLERQIRAYCHPDSFSGVADRFYRNRGDGTFEDATAAAGFSGATGKGLGLVFTDVDADGWPDLYVANDMTANFLFRNRGDGTFEEIGLLAGAAYDSKGNAEAGMGVEAGDLDGDDRTEIIATHIDEQSNALYGYLGAWLFADRRFVSRLAEPSFYRVGFGVAFADLDQDGDLDVALANGHIIDNIDRFKTTTTFRQPNQIFANDGRGRFAEVAEAGLTVVRSSRGLAAGDLDGDGDLDLAINDSNDLAEVYENRTGEAGEGSRGGWVQVGLSRAAGEPFGVGARIEVTSDLAGVPRDQWREVRTGASYLSQHALAAHFGLGAARTIDRLTVRWPDGAVQRFADLPGDRRYRVGRPP